MTARADIPFTNEHFARWCGSMTGQPYWYGTCCYRASESLLKNKARQYPKYYGNARRQRCREDIAAGAIVADCIGGCKGYAWTDGGQGIPAGGGGRVRSRYQSNGCPDKGANGMFSWAKARGMAWGTIDTLPEVPGLALWKDGHTGYYAGGGEAVEWRGFSFGCVKTKVADRPWTHWYALPFIDYGDAVPARVLCRGSVGADVRTLQVRLNAFGAGLAADGRYGAKTERAVREFQKWNGLKPDGRYGKETAEKLRDSYTQ